MQKANKMIELIGKYNKDCKIFIDEIESEAYSLIQNILDEEVSEGVPIRIMPDTHVGKNIVIGFTMPITTMLDPNHVGVDIGCGMLSARLDAKFDTKDLKEINELIRQNIPMGVNIHKTNKATIDLDFLNSKLMQMFKLWVEHFGTEYEIPNITEKYLSNLYKRIGIEEKIFYRSLGSLGGGNHFIEMGTDQQNETWITFHSGSRNFGLKICKYHLHKARLQQNNTTEYAVELDHLKSAVENKNTLPVLIADLKRKYNLGIPKKYLQGKNMFDYCTDMVIAQYYANLNRKSMLNIFCKETGTRVSESIESIHNYIDFDDFIIRKGAVAAYAGQKLIIPFNMRDGILVCEGKGNLDWNCSAPHGAGRVLSRSHAKEKLSMEEFTLSMEGIYSTSVCSNTLDEAPMAYKDAELIELLIEPTVNIVNRIKPILNIKSIY